MATILSLELKFDISRPHEKKQGSSSNFFQTRPFLCSIRARDLHLDHHEIHSAHDYSTGRPESKDPFCQRERWRWKNSRLSRNRISALSAKKDSLAGF